ERYWPDAPGAEPAISQSNDDSRSLSALSPVLELLHQGDATKLRLLLEDADRFSDAEAAALPKVLGVLVERHQQHVDAAAVGEWLYRLDWQLQPRPEAAVPADELGGWLILADRGGVGRALAETLRRQGHACAIAYARTDSHGSNGTSSDSPLGDADAQFLDPTSAQEVAKWFAGEAAKFEHPVRGAIHLWSLDASSEADLDRAGLERAQALGCAGGLHLVQALTGLAQDRSPLLWMVTRGAAAISGTEVGVAQTPVWGLGKVVAWEHPDLWGGMVDLAPGAGLAPAAAREADILLTEITGDRTEDALAWRDGERYVARLVADTSFDAAALPTESLQPDATYWVTGGLGALGLEIAAWLTRRGARSLALTGRRSPSDAARDAIARLEARGVRVRVFQADVADGERMAEVLAEIEASMSPVRGIVHAAGLLDDGILQQMSWERFARVMSPKMTGAWILHDILGDRPLDFFVLFSSMAGLLGSPGQGNYAAANAFLDGLACYRRSRGLPATSINWGPWEQAGMAAALDREQQERWSSQGLTLISATRGLRALDHILDAGAAQAAVLPIDWTIFGSRMAAVRHVSPLLQDWVGDIESDAQSETAIAAQKAVWQEMSAAPASERHDLLVAHLQAEAALVLRLPESQAPDPQLGFFEMGMDSLMAVEFKNRLETGLERSLPATLTFEAPSIDALATYLAESVMGWETDALSHELAVERVAVEQRSARVEEVEELSEEDVEASIEAQLNRLEALLSE
ncbi:MAG: beta-ketoacyl reductase, partial [Cyanobacteria bacterium J06639_1]